jgi:SSS family solute:Na+ symporter
VVRPIFRPIDWAVLALYALFLALIGLWRPRTETEDYLIAGRRLGLPVFVATLVATWYGGILGVGEFVYGDGVAAWLAQGLPYYIFAIAFALTLASRVRSASLYTIPDKLEEAYDRRTALFGAGLALLYASPSTYVLMIGTLLHLLFGWPLITSMIVGALFSVVYVVRGGFLSDVRVNTLQFGLMFLGFALVVTACVHRYGLHMLRTHLPATHLTLMGTHSPLWALTWALIAFTTLTDPGWHQRCYAARTPRIAVFGILAAVVCWMTFDALSTTSGLYARALVPGLADAKLAYPALAERVLSPGMKGLFYVGMLAPIMASAVSYTFISAMTIGRDFIWRLRAEPTNERIPGFTRIGLLITSVLAIGTAVALPSVVEQWYVFGNLIVSGMLIPLLGAYSSHTRLRTRPGAALASMAAGTLAAAIWLAFGFFHGGLDDSHNFPLQIPPMAAGLFSSAIFYLAGLAPDRPAG